MLVFLGAWRVFAVQVTPRMEFCKFAVCERGVWLGRVTAFFLCLALRTVMLDIIHSHAVSILWAATCKH